MEPPQPLTWFFADFSTGLVVWKKTAKTCNCACLLNTVLKKENAENKMMDLFIQINQVYNLIWSQKGLHLHRMQIEFDVEKRLSKSAKTLKCIYEASKLL